MAKAKDKTQAADVAETPAAPTAPAVKPAVVKRADEVAGMLAAVNKLAELYGVPASGDTEALLAKLCELHGVEAPGKSFESVTSAINRLRSLAGV